MSLGSNAPRVSVAMVTFQHADFIDQAIESVAGQDEPSWELVIGDDQSADGTLARALRWQERYPKNIRVLDPVPEKLLGRRNYERTIRSCRGQYVAQLDGDDWFMQPHKLRVQADYLDAHPELSGCVTASQEFHANGEPDGDPVMVYTKAGVLTSRDFLRMNRAASSTVVWRRGLPDPFPDWWWKAPVGDWPLHMLNLEHGPYGYINEVMGSHRGHPGGVWSQKTPCECLQIELDCQAGFLENLTSASFRRERAGFVKWRWRRARDMMRDGDPERALLMFNWLSKFSRYLDPITRVRATMQHKRARSLVPAANE